MKMPRSVPRAGGIQLGAIPWFDESTYPQMLGVVRDRANHPPTYEAWRKLALERERDCKSQQMLTVRVKINIDEFVGWCRNLTIDPSKKTLEGFADLRAVGRVYDR